MQDNDVGYVRISAYLPKMHGRKNSPSCGATCDFGVHGTVSGSEFGLSGVSVTWP